MYDNILSSIAKETHPVSRWETRLDYNLFRIVEKPQDCQLGYGKCCWNE